MSRDAEVSCPALLQDHRVVSLPSDQLRPELRRAMGEAFHGAAREDIERGEWTLRRRRLGQVQDVTVRVDDHGSRSEVSVAVAVARAPEARLATVVAMLAAIASWVVFAASMFSEMRGQQSVERVAVWIGSFAAAMLLSWLVLRLATSHRVSAAKALASIDTLWRALDGVEHGPRRARGYRLSPRILVEPTDVQHTEALLAESELAAAEQTELELRVEAEAH
jgi:hypothetical protein